MSIILHTGLDYGYREMYIKDCLKSTGVGTIDVTHRGKTFNLVL